MVEGDDGDTLQRLAEHLAEQSGRSVVQCWEEAVSILRVTYALDVLALDEDGRVVNLGPIEDVDK
jgi:hypothetical protein